MSVVKETKRCSKCKLPKPVGDFNKDRSRPDGLNHRCKPCNTIHQRGHTARAKLKYGRTRQRAYELKHYYGITQADYDAMVLKQGDKCAICGEKPERVLAVDHCHETKVVRGLLCRRCNSAVGFMDHDIERLESALRYLRSFLKPKDKA